MDRARWQQVETIFLAALEQPESSRATFLDDACAGDAELRAEIARLLLAHAADGGLLDAPPARVPTEGLPEERRIGPYRLTGLLGRGGMGEVYLAVQEGEGFERPVALKVIRRGMESDEVIRRFTLERQILARLTHPNIARLLDGGRAPDGRPYVVMEYVDGVRIDAYCDRELMGVERRLELFLTVCEAVQHAHQNLVVHRDLKPGNIIVTTEGAPKLLDFGIGKLVTLEEGVGEAVTRTGMRVLTPDYASPEQLRGEPVSAGSDVYSLGVLLYELLTGHHPMGVPESLTELERAVLYDEPGRPSQAVTRVEERVRNGNTETLTPEGVSMLRGTDPGRLRRRLAGDLDNILLKALRKDPARRYGTPSALADDIRRHLEGRPVRARPDTFSYRAGKFIRRYRLPLGAAAMVFLSMAAATAYSLEQSRRVGAERDRALEVEGFLLEMFGSTSPDQETGNTVTARQLLDGQVEALAQYDDQPGLRARMTRVLAEGYDRLGLYAEAERLARASLEVQRAELPEGDPEIARSLTLLGWIHHERGRSESGAELLGEAIPMWRAAGDAAGLSRALNDLGVIREAHGDYASADTLYTEALELRRGRFGNEHRAFAITASNLSVVRYRQGRYQEAVAAGRQALAAMRGALGPDHQRSIIVQNNLAAIQAALGDIAGAEALYRDLVARQERLQGPQHPVTLTVVRSHAAVLENLGRFDESVAAYQRALAGQERNLGPDHPEVALARARLASALTGQGEGARVIPLLEEALEDLLAAYGEEHQRVAETLESLAVAYWTAHDDARAEALHRRAIESIDAALGADHPTAGATRMRLADYLARRDRTEEALAHYAEAHRTFQQSLPARHAHNVRTRLRMAQMNVWLERWPAADSLVSAAAVAAPDGDFGDYRALYDSLVARVAEAGSGG